MAGAWQPSREGHACLCEPGRGLTGLPVGRSVRVRIWLRCEYVSLLRFNQLCHPEEARAQPSELGGGPCALGQEGHSWACVQSEARGPLSLWALCGSPVGPAGVTPAAAVTRWCERTGQCGGGLTPMARGQLCSVRLPSRGGGCDDL